MKTKDLVIVSLIAALSTVLSMLVIYRMPNGGSISLYLVPLFLLTFKKGVKLSLLCMVVVAILQVIFGGYVLGVFQVLLDYVIPLMLISLIAIAREKSFGVQFVVILVVMLLMLLSYTTSGVIYFGVTITASLAYNMSYFIPTYVSNIIVALLIRNRIDF